MTARVAGSRNRSSVGIHPAAGRSAWAWPRRFLAGRGTGLPGGDAARRRDLRQVRDRRGRLVQVPGAQHHPDPAVQLVQAEQSHRVVLAQQRHQPFAVGFGGQRPRAARAGHGYPVGRTTTAVP